jgi:Protein of unknown function (DUF3891)
MLRSKASGGWWLVTHPDHAHLAGEFARYWGNGSFTSPEPRAHVLRGIHCHDDGWRARDAQPVITRQGTPAAFSVELVGKYSAFEDIDLSAYLAVRREAVRLMAKEDAYAAILISMHTYNLLSERADRSTIREDELPLLDAFLKEQKNLQTDLRNQLIATNQLLPSHLDPSTLHRHFQLLQACDNLSLLSCVDFDGHATLLHPFTTVDGVPTEIKVQRVAERTFQLSPYPFSQSRISLTFPARFVPGETFASSEDLRDALHRAETVNVPVTVTA